MAKHWTERFLKREVTYGHTSWWCNICGDFARARSRWQAEDKNVARRENKRLRDEVLYHIGASHPEYKHVGEKPRMSAAELRAESQRRAGCRSLSYCPATGALVGVYNANQAGMDDDEPWMTVCEDHSTIVSSRTMALAKLSALDTSEFCEECRGEHVEGE